MHSNESKQVFCFILLTRRGKSPYGRFASICPWGDFWHFYFYYGSRKHMCAQRWSQHAINFNYKNIIVLYSRLAGALWSKVSFRCRNPMVEISNVSSKSIRDFANYRDTSDFFVRLSFSNFLKNIRRHIRCCDARFRLNGIINYATVPKNICIIRENYGFVRRIGLQSHQSRRKRDTCAAVPRILFKISGAAKVGSPNFADEDSGSPANAFSSSLLRKPPSS